MKLGTYHEVQDAVMRHNQAVITDYGCIYQAGGEIEQSQTETGQQIG